MSDLFSYNGKKVVLTGGATGVGAAAVDHLADLGCTDLTVLDVKEPTGPASRFLPTDMSDTTTTAPSKSGLTRRLGLMGLDPGEIERVTP